MTRQTAAIDRVRTDALGPGQRFAIAAIEVYDRVLTRDNEVTIRRDPAHSKVAGNSRRIRTPRQQRGGQPRTTTTTTCRMGSWPRPAFPTSPALPPKPDRAPRRSGSPATCAPSAGTGLLRGEACAASTHGAQRKSWPGGITRSSPAMERLGRAQ